MRMMQLLMRVTCDTRVQKLLMVMTGIIITIALVKKLPIQHCLLYVSQVTEDLNALLSPNAICSVRPQLKMSNQNEPRLF